tara:strand:- start:204 stop:950 length:747 start_codon:yes stop_codon:yes gene_type:complete
MKYLYVNGCSMSEGACMVQPNEDNEHLPNPSVDYDNRWSSLLAKKMGLVEINEAEHGGSNDRIVRMTLEWCLKNQNKIKDTLFVIGWTLNDRFELWDDYEKRYIQIANGGPTSDDFDNKRLISDVQSYIRKHFDHSECRDNFMRRIIFLQSFLENNKLEYLFFDAIGTVIEIINTNRLSKFINKKYWWGFEDNEIYNFSRVSYSLKSYGVDASTDDLTGELSGHPGHEAHLEMSKILYKRYREINEIK